MEKELIDKLYKLGKIRPVEEAFIEYPVEEEWHKGKAESFLEEEKEDYDVSNIGDIVFVKKYKYQNGKCGYKHLFVIIEKNNYAVPIEYFALLISSHLDKLKYESNQLILKNERNNLAVDSIMKTDVIYKINQKNIMLKIGTMDENIIEDYMKKLSQLF